MSDHIDPGPGWREVTYAQWRSDECPSSEDTTYVRIGREEHYYFREAPVPPLPTEPYTVIRVTWRSGAADDWMRRNDDWLNVETQTAADDLRSLGVITGWEPLAEPRAVTARAVLDEVEKVYPGPGPRGREGWKRRLAEKFGVDL